MRHEKVILDKSQFEAIMEKLSDLGGDAEENKNSLERNAEEVVIRCHLFCVELVRGYRAQRFEN